MPELPETETIARDLGALLPGSRIDSVTVRRRDVLRGPLSSAVTQRVTGLVFDGVSRRAKTIVLQLSRGFRLLVTPRFTGRLQVDATPDSYTAIEFVLSGGSVSHLQYWDVRRLGTVALVDEPGWRAFDASLGPEPLSEDFDTKAMVVLVRRAGVPIKRVLMDQRRVAGVGNIYANESLFCAGIDPSRPASSLAGDEVGRLVVALRDVLTRAIAARGTTFRDYRDARNERGAFAEQLVAYGRGGEPCARCGTRLVETHAIDGRSTVFCFRCQR